MSREQGPREAGMRPTANAAGRRQCGGEIVTSDKEAAV
jgi:hypothetical protein